MSLENQAASIVLMPEASFWLVVRVALLTLAGLYFVFGLILVRQVNLMTETLITETSPVLRAFAIIHAGMALGIVILFFGFLFG